MKHRTELLLIRLADIVLALWAVFLLFLPILVIAVLILIIDGKPVVFSQPRSGLRMRTFYIFKFRTMHSSSRREELNLGARHPQITKLGAFLRRYKLDEIPQFYNVLKGEMSLVGPRPQILSFTEKYSKEYTRALVIRPGIFSPASMRYSREEEIYAASDDPAYTYEFVVLPDKLRLDASLAEQFGVRLYVRTLIQGILTMMGSTRWVSKLGK